jgi:hypothetical protein
VATGTRALGENWRASEKAGVIDQKKGEKNAGAFSLTPSGQVKPSK